MRSHKYIAHTHQQNWPTHPQKSRTHPQKSRTHLQKSRIHPQKSRTHPQNSPCISARMTHIALCFRTNLSAKKDLYICKRASTYPHISAHIRTYPTYPHEFIRQRATYVHTRVRAYPHKSLCVHKSICQRCLHLQKSCLHPQKSRAHPQKGRTHPQKSRAHPQKSPTRPQKCPACSHSYHHALTHTVSAKEHHTSAKEPVHICKSALYVHTHSNTCIFQRALHGQEDI